MDQIFSPQVLEILTAGGSAGTWGAVYILQRIHTDVVDLGQRVNTLEVLNGIKAKRLNTTRGEVLFFHGSLGCTYP